MLGPFHRLDILPTRGGGVFFIVLLETTRWVGAQVHGRVNGIPTKRYLRGRLELLCPFSIQIRSGITILRLIRIPTLSNCNTRERQGAGHFFLRSPESGTRRKMPGSSLDVFLTSKREPWYITHGCPLLLHGGHPWNRCAHLVGSPFMRAPGTSDVDNQQLSDRQPRGARVEHVEENTAAVRIPRPRSDICSMLILVILLPCDLNQFKCL